MLHHVFDGYDPVDKDLVISSHGSLVSTETGTLNAYGLDNCQERGNLFIGPSVEVYMGMIIGENSRNDDLNLSPCKTKKLTNMRASGSDDAIVLTPPVDLTLELAIEYIGPDELVEVTPSHIRIRKRILNQDKRSIIRSVKKEDEE